MNKKECVLKINDSVWLIYRFTRKTCYFCFECFLVFQVTIPHVRSTNRQIELYNTHCDPLRSHSLWLLLKRKISRMRLEIAISFLHQLFSFRHSHCWSKLEEPYLYSNITTESLELPRISSWRITVTGKFFFLVFISENFDLLFFCGFMLGKDEQQNL